MKITRDNIPGLKYILCNEFYSYRAGNFVTLVESFFVLQVIRKRVIFNALEEYAMARVAGHKWMVSFRKLMNAQINYLKYCGLWKLDAERSPFLQNAYFICKIWMLTSMHIFAITVFADIYLNMDNLSIATDGGCIFAGIVVVIFTAMNFQIRSGRIARLMNDILECADDLCEFSNVERIKDIIDKYHLRNKVCFHGFIALACILGVALLFFSPMENGLPIRAKYPFNTTISPWHEIGFLIETCTVFGGLFGITAMDSTMIIQCTLITTLFDILSVNFENCRNLSENDTIRNERSYNRDEHDTKEPDNTFFYRYKACLRFHQRLVSMSNDYNKLYSSNMFVQMLSSTSIICLTGFQAVAVGGQSSDVMKYGIYLSAGISQLFYICWIGNELNHSSSVLNRSQWLSEWHHEHLPSIVNMLTLSMVFTRQPITLKASVFYTLSLETFIVIIKKSYSFFTLLNNMDATDL